ncbi:hypothetical protein P170DRAFT_387034 [Aspergillus steynii IBT 23096]|uniref:Zn(2)-C6 fungal-type domain-containing protein n=1 Tax=Aspergillus steynii IBT 23096 TaxID=1392250 RepID=A0A2I2G6N0_9EURO|nr:uncharacterized protein P170DRAFT_387034 [Aspergillus steynii IBT 23096]PLB48529.1 hypothetical protein P170DRAFT_387034 [Aspergillus steynii IBT 23096]
MRRKVQNAASRQRPVSCQFCRARKLKCNRQLPCGNCISRGIACQLYSQPSTGESVTDPHILERLRRLEDIVMRSQSQRQTSLVADVVTQTPYSDPRYHQATTEVKRLEQECMRQDLSETIHPGGVTFKICPIQPGVSATVAISNSGSCLGEAESVRRPFCLPHIDEARRLLDKYIRDITYLHHVVHIPTLRAVVDGIYEDIGSLKQPTPSHVVLLYSIVASAIYSWTEQDVDLPFCRNGEDATKMSALWVKSTLDLLDYLRRASSKSLEEIQAIIIASFVVCHLEGPSPRYRDLITSAIATARELGLHKIDLPHDPDATSKSPRDPVATEVARRVWWYLVSTDWMFSQYTGPLKGTYSISPRHMAVNKPLNIDDEDLHPSMPTTAAPLNHPTNISYNLQRIHLAEICRELTDSTPLTSGAVEYAQVLKFDRSIIGFTAQWPSFFRLDEHTLNKPAYNAPATATQRYILNSIVPSQRCRLHLPYLARAATDPTYAYSRDACLEAARHVLRTERLLAREETLPFVRMRQRHAGTLLCLCIAIIALLADNCFCRGRGTESDADRRAELADACAILDRAKKESPIAGRLLGYFMRVMREHNVRLPVRMEDELPAGRERTESVAMGSTVEEVPGAPDVSDQLAQWEEIWPWDGLDTELDWDAIISGLGPLI